MIVKITSISLGMAEYEILDDLVNRNIFTSKSDALGFIIGHMVLNSWGKPFNSSMQLPTTRMINRRCLTVNISFRFIDMLDVLVEKNKNLKNRSHACRILIYQFRSTCFDLLIDKSVKPSQHINLVDKKRRDRPRKLATKNMTKIDMRKVRMGWLERRERILGEQDDNIR